MVLLGPDAFITELNKLFVSSHVNGKTVFVSQKRSESLANARGAPSRSAPARALTLCTPSSRAVLPRGTAQGPPQCLYRAVHGVRKISTVVGANDSARFHPMYVTVLKSSTPGMKRTKKPNKKKAKAAPVEAATS